FVDKYLDILMQQEPADFVVVRARAGRLDLCSHIATAIPAARAGLGIVRVKPALDRQEWQFHAIDETRKRRKGKTPKWQAIEACPTRRIRSNKRWLTCLERRTE